MSQSQWWGAMLSHPLDIKGSVSRYLTNYLVSRRPLLWRNKPFAPGEIIQYYRQFPAAILVPRVRSDALLPRLPLLHSGFTPKGIHLSLSLDLHA